MLVALLAAVPAFADPSIRSKEAEAQQVLTQMNALDSDLEQAVERYNSANVRLDLIRKAQRQNAFELTIAKRNVELNNGTIEVESAPGAGTTVRLRFPAAAGV